MRRFARSLTRFSLASTLFGAERVAGLLRDQKGRVTARSLDTVTETAASSMSELAHALFHAGDTLGREWFDLSSQALGSGDLQPVLDRLAARSAEGLRFASPGPEGQVARAELRNKLGVYQWVRRARQHLGEDPATAPPALEASLERLARLEPSSALWLLEGIGYRHAAARRADDPAALGGSSRGLLRDLDQIGVPPRWRPLLHAGLGLAIARGQLDQLASNLGGARPEERSFGRAVGHVLALCRHHAEPRHWPTAFESLGMAARYFHPDLVPPIERALRRLTMDASPASDDHEPDLRGLFWHGCGRGAYFAPVQLLPGYGSLENALETVRREAPIDRQAPALAGLGYAFALVNLGTPEVLEGALLRHLATEAAPASDTGSADEKSPRPDPSGEPRATSISFSASLVGASAALHMRYQVTPDSPIVHRLLAYEPALSVRETWRALGAGLVDPARSEFGLCNPLYVRLLGRPAAGESG